MTEYKEAFDELKEVLYLPDKYLEKRLNILHELVEKATPKKAISHGIRPGREINTVSYTCPVCDKHIGVDNFCKFCGQAIDWSNDDE